MLIKIFFMTTHMRSEKNAYFNSLLFSQIYLFVGGGALGHPKVYINLVGI